MTIVRSAALALTLSLTLVSAPAQPSAARKAELDRDMKELQNFTLNMDVVTRTTMVMYEFSQLPKSAAPPASADDDDANEQTLDGMEKKFRSIPQAVAILNAHNLTARTMALTFLCLIQTGIAAYALEQGAKESDVIGQGQVNPANLAFYRAHKADIEALNAKYPVKSE